jgi:septal ring factor EnvC (AmiA/AmiB activator)
LRSEQDEAARLAREVAATAPRLRAAQAAQAAQAAALDQALAIAQQRRAREDAENKDQAQRAVQRAAEQAAQHAAEAYSVGGAVDRLDSARRRDTPRPSPLRHEVALARPAAPATKGAGVTRLAVPVAGRISQGWGSPTDAGPAGGLTYRAPPRARVSAPCAGRVAFAGPFRSFGLLVILDCGGGYDVVMSGLASLDVQVGQAVQSGEPVGTMPAWDPQEPGSRPGLYVELRRDGRRIDPSPFLNARG